MSFPRLTVRCRSGLSKRGTLFTALLAVSIFFAVHAETAALQTVPATSATQLRFLGRTVPVGTSMAFDWSNSGFEFIADCEGKVTASITGTPGWQKVGYLQVTVDGKTGERIPLAPGTQDYVLAEALPKGRHQFRVCKLNEAWGTNYPQWSSMDGPLTFKDPLSQNLLADFSKLLTSLAEQYFRTVSQELKKADPNHLDLGCRFAGFSPEILGQATKYCDVLSFNVYRLSLDPCEWEILDAYDKPFLIGEFHFGATDRGMFDGGLVGVADQNARGQACKKYLGSVLAHPKCIGAHWFQYTDQPTTGRTGDGENGNIGFVSITDTPYPELIQAAREINSAMYPTRFAT